RRADERPEVRVAGRVDRDAAELAHQHREAALEIAAHVGLRRAADLGDLGAGDALEQAEDEALARGLGQLAQARGRLLPSWAPVPPPGSSMVVPGVFATEAARRRVCSSS